MPRRASRERRKRESLNKYRSTIPTFTTNEQAQAYIDAIEEQCLINLRLYRERLEEEERLKNLSWCEWFRMFFK